MNHVLNITLVIVGIVAMTVMPPIGLIVIGIAFASDRSRRKALGRHRQAIAYQQAMKARRARILAFKSL